MDLFPFTSYSNNRYPSYKDLKPGNGQVDLDFSGDLYPENRDFSVDDLVDDNGLVVDVEDDWYFGQHNYFNTAEKMEYVTKMKPFVDIQAAWDKQMAKNSNMQRHSGGLCVFLNS